MVDRHVDGAREARESVFEPRREHGLRMGENFY
jgi:hypothetical protein